MLRAFVTAYPWDLIDEGIEPVLDRLQGEIGVTGMSLWAVVPPVVELRARDVEPRIFRTGGGLCFQPSERHYVETRFKPAVADGVHGRESLRRISEACAKRGLDLRLIVSAAAAGRVVQRHPELACKNVFGDASQRNLCLANPDVQSYLCGLAADLSSNYSWEGLSLIHFTLGWSEAFGDDLAVGVSLRDAARRLLAICFCESCRQKAVAAGVDVPAAARSAQVILEKHINAEASTDTAPDALGADNEPLTAYTHWRAAELCSLLRRIKKACAKELLLYRCTGALGADQLEEADQLEGLDLTIPDGIITRLRDSTDLASARSPTAQRNELQVSEAFVVGSDTGQLVSLMSHAVELGFTGIEISNYGMLPDATWIPIKQAFRFAKRSAPD